MNRSTDRVKKSSNSSTSVGLRDRAYGLVKRLFYRLVRFISRMVGVLVFDLRCIGREHTEVNGGALILSTHQSHLDPVLIGVTFNEHLNYLARRTLFKNPLFGLVITLLDAIELDRDRSGLAGLKETMKRLRRDKKVLIFPEGTRTSDGKIAPLKPGFLSVARRSGVPLIPIAVTGAFEALPRTRASVLRYPLRVSVGRAIQADEFRDLDDQAMLQLVQSRLEACYQSAQASRT